MSFIGGCPFPCHKYTVHSTTVLCNSQTLLCDCEGEGDHIDLHRFHQTSGLCEGLKEENSLGRELEVCQWIETIFSEAARLEGCVCVSDNK